MDDETAIKLSGGYVRIMSNASVALITLGLIGQVCFFMRFLVQWIVSEYKRKSVIPMAFWYFSIVGSILLLIYSIIRKDIVFISGQSIGLIVYFRNIILHKNQD